MAATEPSAFCPPREMPGSLSSAVLCRGLTKEFLAGEGRVHALRGVDAHIPAGELALLVGPSGCGKTTLLYIIAGLLEPTQGQVLVLGADLTALKGDGKVRFRRDQMGFVFQQYHLLPAFTALENVAVPLVVAGVPKREAMARGAALLETLGMGSRMQARPGQLSGGQQQRVAIARALVHEPRLLVCDEPTAALDGQAGRAVMHLLRQLAVRPNRAVIIVTHDNRVFDFADRIFSMEDGCIVDTRTCVPATNVPESHL
jgi:putative ABC transport system ATP-binding protein